jgi:nucleoside-diphosphate-sugar epimerase
MPGHRRRRLHRIPALRAPPTRRQRRRRPRRLHPLLPPRRQGGQPRPGMAPPRLRLPRTRPAPRLAEAALDGVEAVFHLAAMPGLPRSWTDFDLYQGCNFQATQRLLEGVRHRGGLRRFVYASTSSVYGRDVPATSRSRPTRSRTFAPPRRAGRSRMHHDGCNSLEKKESLHTHFFLAIGLCRVYNLSQLNDCRLSPSLAKRTNSPRRW